MYHQQLCRLRSFLIWTLTAGKWTAPNLCKKHQRWSDPMQIMEDNDNIWHNVFRYTTELFLLQHGGLYWLYTTWYLQHLSMAYLCVNGCFLILINWGICWYICHSLFANLDVTLLWKLRPPTGLETGTLAIYRENCRLWFTKLVAALWDRAFSSQSRNEFLQKESQ